MSQENKEITIGEIKSLQKLNFPFLTDEMLTDLISIDILLKTNGIPFIVIGSIAMATLGVPINRPIKDIDIEVIANEEQEQLFKQLAESQGKFYHNAPLTDNDRGFDHNPYLFKLGNTEVNIWVSREHFTHPHLVKRGGIFFPTLETMLKRKAIMHRKKDLADLVYYAGWIIRHIVDCDTDFAKAIEGVNWENFGQLADKIDTYVSDNERAD